MADARDPEPVIVVTAVISRYPLARDWAIDRLRGRFGALLCQSDPLPFTASGYYTAAMGPELEKVLVACRQPADPAGLADWKVETNRWESEFAAACRAGTYRDSRGAPITVPRPLNLDCGYVTQAKLVLATTKDRDHRIYLREGIFAEVTLSYTRKRWVDHRWTYPDYRDEAVLRFAERCRRHLREQLMHSGQWRAQPQADVPPLD